MTALGNLVYQGPRGSVYYTPSDPRAGISAPARLPTPLFQARQRRPLSIHITRFPPGFQFVDPSPPKQRRRNTEYLEELKAFTSSRKQNAKRVFSLVLSSFASRISVRSAASSTRSITPDSFRTPSILLQVPSEVDLNNSPTILPSAEENMAATLGARGLHNLGAASRSAINLTLGGDTRKQSISTTRPITATKAVSAERPLASVKGVTCDIVLAEPYVYLTGFDHGNGFHSSQNSTAMIRGKMVLNVIKGAKIKAVTLSFCGRANTQWPEGIPPEKTRTEEEEKLRYQVLPFFNSSFKETGPNEPYGAQCRYTLRGDNTNQSSTNLSMSGALTLDDSPASMTRSSRSSTSFSAREIKSLSIGSMPSRSFTKGESPAVASQQQKGYKFFPPGTYEYTFEIALDHTSPETIEFPLGGVKWFLEALVERPGPFNPNLHGSKEVRVIRAPDQNSLEQVEPIAIGRRWEDQLHYDIVISGKSFALGSKIPIAFKLTPLAKVQCHRIKVFITENVDYYCNNKKVTRRDAPRKILLLERQAGKPLAPQFETSDVRMVSGGEVDVERRERSRAMAQHRRNNEARRLGMEPEPLPAPVDNILGDLDLGLEHLVAQTEIEMDVQLPTCAQMAKDKSLRISPDTTYKNIQVHHWIKIVLRLSRLDTEDPTGTKRRHFEISIDSPFHILSCLATQAHTTLPEYSDPQSFPGNLSHTPDCGCPNAASLPNQSPSSSTGSIPTLSDSVASLDGPSIAAAELPQPPAAHLSAVHAVQRPIHMLRHPSYAPPAFSDEDPPPALPTPPPNYDHVMGTPSHHEAISDDYFARFAQFDQLLVDNDDDDNDYDDYDELQRTLSRNGVVNVANPRTPGGRIARSMEINREFLLQDETLSELIGRRRGESRASQETAREGTGMGTGTVTGTE